MTALAFAPLCETTNRRSGSRSDCGIASGSFLLPASSDLKYVVRLPDVAFGVRSFVSMLLTTNTTSAPSDAAAWYVVMFFVACSCLIALHDTTL